MGVKSRCCPKCNQPNNPSFKNCWKCKASLDDGCDGKTKDGFDACDGKTKEEQDNDKFNEELGKKLEATLKRMNEIDLDDLAKKIIEKDKRGSAVTPEPIQDEICYADVYRQYSQMCAAQRGTQTVSDEVKRHVDMMLAHPDARPAAGDGTFEAWLLRISLWGKIKITHNNPNEKIENGTMTTDQFLDYTDDQNRNDLCGKWVIEYPKINLIQFVRRFNSESLGKMVTEELVVEIDLREGLEEILKKSQGGKQ